MSTECEYEIVLRPEPEGGFSVFVPELPSVGAQGETIEEATTMAKEAIEVYLEVMHEDGLPIPTVHRSSVAVHARGPKSEDCLFRGRSLGK
jgi:antitoxin HicB